MYDVSLPLSLSRSFREERQGAVAQSRGTVVVKAVCSTMRGERIDLTVGGVRYSVDRVGDFSPGRRRRRRD